MTLEVNGARTGNVVNAPAIFNNLTLYSLSYTLNTSTGILSNVIYNGTDVTSYFAGQATSLNGSNTSLIGFYGSSAGTGLDTGTVDDFMITTPVPEAATWVSGALLSTVGLVAFFRRALRAKRSKTAVALWYV